MPFRIDELIAKRPCIYHLTAADNLARIKATRQIESAAELMRRAGRLDLLRVRRRVAVPIEVDGTTILLRDQAPLHNGHIAFETGWDLPRLIEFINSRVFFWPGNEVAPIDYGQRHFGRYEAEGPAVLRIGLREAVQANQARPPLFCPYNSGSPRTVSGKKSPRGPNTFLPCDTFPHGHARVVEVTFLDQVTLPTSVEVRVGAGPWKEL